MKRVILLFVLALGIMLTQTNVFAVDNDVGVIKTEIIKVQKATTIAPMITTNFQFEMISLSEEMLFSRQYRRITDRFDNQLYNGSILFTPVFMGIDNLCNLHKIQNTDILHSRQWFGTHFGKINIHLRT